MELENLEIYKISMSVGERVREIVSCWKYFEKETTLAIMLNKFINSTGKSNS